MKRNRHRLSRFVSARTFWVRAVAAWRELLPDWKPTLEMLQALDNMPLEHQRAVRVVAHGWDYNDPRWDVLMALMEWERREERARRSRADELTRVFQDMNCGGLAATVTGVDCRWCALGKGCVIHDDFEEGRENHAEVREDHTEGVSERTLPNLRPVQPPSDDVHADTEPVEQERLGADEERGGDRKGAAGPGPRLVKPPKRVFSLRDAAAAHAPRDGNGGGG